MKIITQQLFERGDLVMVTKGFSNGMVGVVKAHERVDRGVEVLLANTIPSSGDDWDEDEDSVGFMSDGLKLITKDEYDKVLKDKKILKVPGLLVPILLKHGLFMFGDNEVKSADAVKIAEFILANQPKKKPTTKRK